MIRFCIVIVFSILIASCGQNVNLPQPKILNSGSNLSDALLNNSGNLVLIGETSDKKGLISVINEVDTGAMWTTKYESDKEEGFKKILLTQSNEYLILGSQKLDSSNALKISKIDSRGNMIWSKIAKDANGNSTLKGLVLANGQTIIASSYNAATPLPYTNVFCMNEDGKIVWNKKIEQIEKVIGIKKVGNGIMLITKQKGTFINMTDGSKYFNFPIFLLDERGEMVDVANSILTPKTPDTELDFDNVIEANNQYFILGYTKNSLSQYKAMSVICFDQMAKPIWAKRYDTSTDGIFRVGQYDEKTKKVVLWADSYGTGNKFYSCLLNEKGEVDKANSYIVPSASNIKSLVSNSTKTLLTWNQAGAFAFAKSDANGQVGLQDEKLTIKGVDIPISIRKNGMTVLVDSTFTLQDITTTKENK